MVVRELRSIAFQLMSALGGLTATSMIFFSSDGRPLYLAVEEDLELLAALVEALQHAVLDHVGKPSTRSDGVVELGRVDQAAVERRHDLAAGQRVDGGAQFGEHVDRQADGAVLQALEVLDRGDRLLNQPSGCVGIGP